MTEVQQLKERLESLEEHVARLEGIIHVLLEELEADTIRASAAELRAAMPRLDDA